MKITQLVIESDIWEAEKIARSFAQGDGFVNVEMQSPSGRELLILYDMPDSQVCAALTKEGCTWRYYYEENLCSV